MHVWLPGSRSAERRPPLGRQKLQRCGGYPYSLSTSYNLPITCHFIPKGGHSNLPNPRPSLDRLLHQLQRGQKILIRRLVKRPHLRDIHRRCPPIVRYRLLISKNPFRTRHTSQEGINSPAPKFANPSNSSSPQIQVLGESSGITNPYVLSASLVLPRNTFPSTSIWLSLRECSAWYR